LFITPNHFKDKNGSVHENRGKAAIDKKPQISIHNRNRTTGHDCSESSS